MGVGGARHSPTITRSLDTISRTPHNLCRRVQPRDKSAQPTHTQTQCAQPEQPTRNTEGTLDNVSVGTQTQCLYRKMHTSVYALSTEHIINSTAVGTRPRQDATPMSMRIRQCNQLYMGSGSSCTHSDGAIQRGCQTECSLQHRHSSVVERFTHGSPLRLRPQN